LCAIGTVAASARHYSMGWQHRPGNEYNQSWFPVCNRMHIYVWWVSLFRSLYHAWPSFCAYYVY